jgi:hypothetical protein
MEDLTTTDQQRLESLERRIFDLETIIDVLLATDQQQLSSVSIRDKGLTWPFHISSGNKAEDHDPSNANIDACVDDFLIKEGGVMGPAKRLLYKQLLRLLVKFARDGLSTASVNVYGHQLKFSLTPIVSGATDE